MRTAQTRRQQQKQNKPPTNAAKIAKGSNGPSRPAAGYAGAWSFLGSKSPMRSPANATSRQKWHEGACCAPGAARAKARHGPQGLIHRGLLTSPALENLQNLCERASWAFRAKTHWLARVLLLQRHSGAQASGLRPAVHHHVRLLAPTKKLGTN